MRFICEKCEIPMELEKKDNPPGGFMKLSFICRGCNAGFSMVTNSEETQLINNMGLGEKIGENKEAKLPDPAEAARNLKEDDSPVWTPEAQSRLDNAPPFVRPMAKMAAEKIALEKGRMVIDEALMDEVRARFMDG